MDLLPGLVCWLRRSYKICRCVFSVINSTYLAVSWFILDEPKKCGHRCVLMPLYLSLAGTGCWVQVGIEWVNRETLNRGTA